jgi:hypothetical protein
MGTHGILREYANSVVIPLKITPTVSKKPTGRQKNANW